MGIEFSHEISACADDLGHIQILKKRVHRLYVFRGLEPTCRYKLFNTSGISVLDASYHRVTIAIRCQSLSKMDRRDDHDRMLSSGARLEIRCVLLRDAPGRRNGITLSASVK